MTSEVWDEETAARYDADTADMSTSEALRPTINFLEELAGSGRALEFAIGTGRVGVALAGRGVQVCGIELSEPMVRELRRKVEESALPVAVGNMTTARVPGEFSLVYLVFNGLSNLQTQAEQVACFQNASRHLVLGGRFVIELWVPPLRRMPPGQTAVPNEVSEGHLGFDTYDPVHQMCTSHHYVKDADGTVRYDFGNFRYAWPAECDLMAQLAGMQLEGRFSEWYRGVFTAESDSHVSVYRKG